MSFLKQFSYSILFFEPRSSRIKSRIEVVLGLPSSLFSPRIFSVKPALRAAILAGLWYHSAVATETKRRRSFGPPPVRVSALVPADVRERLDQLAAAHGVTLGTVVAEAVDEGLSNTLAA